MHYETKKQITVTVEDRPGMLAYICKILADAKVNIRDVSTSDFRKQGMIRVIPDNPSVCEKAFRDAGLIPLTVEVIAVVVTDNPGSLATITSALALCNIQIEYIYGTANPFNPLNLVSFFNWFTDRIRLILKVSDIPETIRILKNIK
ncbi:MAG: ACT domain-containing protein [Nitrosopumilaceae archaeon]